MRIPDPKANTTTEAYLAYKAGYLEESELKPTLYKPYLHFDAWLAYWDGLTIKYPGNKNLFFGLSGTESGVTGTLGKDGVVSVSGTATTTGGARVIVDNDASLKAGTYTLSISEPQASVVNMIVNTNGGSNISFRITAGSTSATNTIPEGSVGVTTGLYYGITNGTTYNESFKVQFIAGDAPDYDLDPYTANPEMLCDEEALVAYLSGVTDTYPEDIKDPYDVRIVGYLKYLVSARWGRPEYPVNNEEFYLSTMKPPVVPSGDPSSDIEIDDTAEAPFIDLKMYGDTEQNSYTGKNLLELSGRTSSGVTGTVNADGSCTISGTANVTDGVSLFRFEGVLPAGTYTLSLSKALPSVINLSLASGVALRIPAGSTSATITTTEEYGPAGVFVGVVNGTSYNETFNMQLVTGGTPDYDFEPYTGGQASPSPSYPQDVRTVSGRQLVNVYGKNLANLDIDSSTSYGVQITNNGDQTLTFKGTATSSIWPPVMENRIPVEVGKTYVMSITEPVNVSLNFRTSRRNEALMRIPAGSTVSNSWSPSEDDEGWAFFTINSGTSVDFTTGVQIEEGSTPTDYQPYTVRSNEINLGKNLAPLYTNSGSISKNGVTLTANEDGTITVNGTATGDSWLEFIGDFTSDIAVRTKPVVRLERGKNYTVSYSILGGSITNTGTAPSIVFQYGYDGSSIESYVKLPDETPVTSVINRNADDFGIYRVWLRSRAGNTYNNLKLGFQLEAGTVATEFKPYFEPIELCKIGNYQDYIYRDEDGDWYLHKAVRHLSLAIADMNNADSYPGWVNIPELQADLGKINQPLEQTTTYNSSVAAVNTGAAVNSNSTGILFLRTEVFGLTQTQWKTLYPSLVYDIYYGIINSITDTQITNSELIAQLNALMEGGSYEGKTYIKVTAPDPNLPGLLYVEAGKYD